MLVGAAFLTLMERRGLGYVQRRKGPNRVGYLGLLQPFGDAIRLFRREIVFPYVGHYYYYFFCPVMGLGLSLFIWMVVPYMENLYMFNLGVLFILSCLRVGVYFLIIAGWSSNSRYSLLGGLRGVAQMISYEVSLMIIFLGRFFLVKSLNMLVFVDYQRFMWMVFFTFPMILIIFIMCLAETNRSPFDLAEGESELVSGFNVEYMGGGFSLIILSEYSRILFIRLLIVVFGLGSCLISLIFYFKLVCLGFVFVLIRASFPRIRYDRLMDFS